MKCVAVAAGWAFMHFRSVCEIKHKIAQLLNKLQTKIEDFASSVDHKKSPGKILKNKGGPIILICTVTEFIQYKKNAYKNNCEDTKHVSHINYGTEMNKVFGCYSQNIEK